MNKNKIIFFIICGALILGLTVFFILVNKKSDPRPKNTSSSGNILVWTYGKDSNDLVKIFGEYKDARRKYSNHNITVETFDDYETYQLTLLNAFNKGVAPDIFILKNGSAGVFESNIQVLDSSVNNPADFRKNTLGIFADDLIVTHPQNPKDEYLKGMLINFDVLGTFYRIRNFKAKDFETWTSLDNAIAQNNTNSNFNPVGAGTGYGVRYNDLIFSSIWAQGGSKNISDSNNGLVQASKVYGDFARLDGNNRYLQLASLYEDKTNIDYFFEEKVGAFFAPMSVISTFDQANANFSSVLATHFPSFDGEKTKTPVWYDVMYLNSGSKNISAINDIFAYLSSYDGQKSVLKHMPYKLPINNVLLDSIHTEKISEKYNFNYKDFIDKGDIFISFDKLYHDKYERKIPDMLDNIGNISTDMQKFYSSETCKHSKIVNFTSLSTPCN